MFVMHIVRNKSNVVVTTLMLMFLLLLLVAITDAIDVIFPIIKQLIIIVYACFCCYYILRYVITTFTYSLINNEFIIRKKTGKKVTTALEISVDDIELICRKTKLNMKYRSVKSQNMTVKIFGFNSYVMIFRTNEGLKKVIVEYDKELIMVLKKSLGKKVIV